MASKVSKAVNILLLIVIAGPILYGLYINDFDIERFLKLDFQTVELEATFHLVDIKAEDKFVLIFRALNNGNAEYNLTIKSIYLEVTGPQVFLNLTRTLDTDLGSIEPGESKDFDIVLESKIPPNKLPEGRYNLFIRLVVEIEFQGEVFTREVEFTGTLSVQ